MAQVNNIVNPDLIKAGDTLVVSVHRPTTTDTGQAAPPPRPRRPGRTCTSQPGDNIYRISLRFGVTMADLIAANGMTPANMNLIRVGQSRSFPADSRRACGRTRADCDAAPDAGAAGRRNNRRMGPSGMTFLRMAWERRRRAVSPFCW